MPGRIGDESGPRVKPISGGLVRFLLEGGFLVLVAAVAAVAHLGAVAIILVMFLAWLLTVVAERVASRREAARVAAPGVSELSPDELIVRVEPPEPTPRRRFWRPRELEPLAAEEPEVEEEPTPEIALEPEEPAAEVPAEEEEEEEEVEAEEPAIEPEPPVLTAVPSPPPEPEVEETPVEELPRPVVALPVRAEPREWNVWELDRRVRELAGEDAARSEELSYLLVYLRGFASPDGMLSVDFDVLVRESFAELIEPALG